MTKKADHSPVTTKQIAELVKKGYPAKTVADMCGISVATVFNRLRRDGYDKFGNKVD